MNIKFLFACGFMCLFVNAGAQIKAPEVLGKKILDTDGRPVNAHGAGVLYYKGVYYLYGEIKNGKTWLLPNQNWEDYRVPAAGVSCYTSTDLVHWRNLGVALSPATGITDSELDTSRLIERPKVVFNHQTKKFVMWMHIDKNDYSYSRAGVAVSDKPEGPYKYLKSYQPNGQMSRDMTLYQDEDGKAYLIYASENNQTMQICALSTDYLSPTTNYIRILENENREAPAVFKQQGKYFLITSLCSGWDPNPATFATADSMMGKWTQHGNPCKGKDAENTFYAQGTYVLPLAGTANQFLFMADRWNKRDLENSEYVWLPLFVKDKVVTIKSSK